MAVISWAIKLVLKVGYISAFLLEKRETKFGYFLKKFGKHPLSAPEIFGDTAEIFIIDSLCNNSNLAQQYKSGHTTISFMKRYIIRANAWKTTDKQAHIAWTSNYYLHGLQTCATEPICSFMAYGRHILVRRNMGQIFSSVMGVRDDPSTAYMTLPVE